MEPDAGFHLKWHSFIIADPGQAAMSVILLTVPGGVYVNDTGLALKVVGIASARTRQ